MQSTSTKYCDTNAHSFPKENDDDEEGSRSSSNNSREICAERLMSILENQQELTPKLAYSAATTTTNNGANNRDTGTNTTLPWSASALPTSVRERYNRRCYTNVNAGKERYTILLDP
eukprot:jgi/Psemu1/20241/gm1.20241_g